MDGFRSARREGFALVTALVSILVVGAALTGGFYSMAMFRSSSDQHALDGAGILAQEALRAFAEQADADQLGRIELGGDSMVTRVRIVTGDALSGALTVRVGHVEPHTFAIKSTGRLETSRGPKICSVDIRWRPRVSSERLQLPPLAPICNGNRPRGLPMVRTHEVDS